LSNLVVTSPRGLEKEKKKRVINKAVHVKLEENITYNSAFSQHKPENFQGSVIVYGSSVPAKFPRP